MPDFKQIFTKVRELWGKWSMVQRLAVAGVFVAGVAAVVVMLTVSASPVAAPLFDTPITDEGMRERIVLRINQEGVKAQVSSAGIISVDDEKTARRMRSILIREDMVPSGMDPWAIFDTERWTVTDFERNVNLQRAITSMVTQHIKALDEVDDANVSIVQPERTLFSADQNPVTASVTLYPKPGSDLSQNRKKIEGIQKILKYAVEGLKDENIVITDQNGLVLNDFAGMAEADRLSLIEKQNKIIRNLEAQYRADILRALQSTYTSDRVRDLNIKFDMDMSQKSVTGQEIKPIILKERTPGLSYDDSQMVPSLTVSESTSTTEWKGTGFNPEGPAGVEGQTAPAYRDMSNLYGEVKQQTSTHNEEFSKEQYEEIRSPTIDRVTVSVNIDGTWQVKKDEKGRDQTTASGGLEREYIPLSAEQIAATRTLIENAIGASANRGDSITVVNIPFDRTAQFLAEDNAIIKKRQFQLTLIAVLAGLALLLTGFIVYQMIVRARERARQRKEEEEAAALARQRDLALLQAEGAGQEVSLSVEEAARQELMEKALAMAREHPADAGQLIRTWLMEE